MLTKVYRLREAWKSFLVQWMFVHTQWFEARVNACNGTVITWVFTENPRLLIIWCFIGVLQKWVHHSQPSGTILAPCLLPDWLQNLPISPPVHPQQSRSIPQRTPWLERTVALQTCLWTLRFKNSHLFWLHSYGIHSLTTWEHHRLWRPSRKDTVCIYVVVFQAFNVALWDFLQM